MTEVKLLLKKQRKINKLIFQHDRSRDALVVANNTREFLETYTKAYDLQNHNTGVYWDKIFSSSGNLSAQSPMTKDKIGIIAEEIPKKNLSILDLGIGDGFVEEKLRERKIKYKLNGIDISRISVKKMSTEYNGKFILGDVLDVKKFFPENAFDIILAIELLEHISVSKIFKLYKTINLLLNKNGRLILSIPINENLHLMESNPSAHVRDYTFNIIREELRLNGFEVERTHLLYAFNSFYGLKKLLSKIIPRWKPNSLVIVARKKS